MWWHRRVSQSRPLVFQTSALLLSYNATWLAGKDSNLRHSGSKPGDSTAGLPTIMELPVGIEPTLPDYKTGVISHYTRGAFGASGRSRTYLVLVKSQLHSRYATDTFGWGRR